MKPTEPTQQNLRIGLTRRGVVAAVLAVTATHWSMPAHAVVATEFTQIMNNWGLMANYVKSSATLVQQITAVTTALKQYKTMVQNLEQLPGAIVSTVTDPVKDVLGATRDLTSSAKSLKDAATEAGSRWQRHVKDAANLKLPPSQYFAQQRKLADSRGGEYKKQYDRDLKSMDRVVERAKDMQAVMDQNPNVTGAVQGFQMLGRQMNEMIESTLSLRFLMTSANSRDLQDRMDKEDAKIRLMDEEKARSEQQKKQSIDIKKFIDGSTITPSWKPQ
jgi:P-type conjugative transfer protein TrbJ